MNYRGNYPIKQNELISIEPPGKLPTLEIMELWIYRDLLFFLVWRDIKVLYKQTVVGIGWAILKPLFTMIVFSVVFGRLAKVPSDGIPYPIFVFVALVPWNYFSTSLNASGMSLVSNTNLITKVYLPRLILPIVPVLSNLLNYGIALVFLFGMMIYYGIYPGWNIIFFPLLVMIMTLTVIGSGMWLSALGIQYRDVNHAMQFIVMMLMYAAPVVYPSSLIPEEYRLLYGVFPMAGVIEGFRASLLSTGPMPWDLLAIGAFVAIFTVVTGILFFNHMEKNFADVA
ncbi:MAG: ABC transporter permease [Candidatus Scalindua sp.]